MYMSQPVGFEDKNHPDFVCKLNKRLYRLRQAPRAWFERLKKTLIEWQFKNSKADSSLGFVKTPTEGRIVLIYVDDIIITGNNPTMLKQFKDKLNKVFALMS